MVEESEQRKAKVRPYLTAAVMVALVIVLSIAFWHPSSRNQSSNDQLACAKLLEATQNLNPPYVVSEQLRKAIELGLNSSTNSIFAATNFLKNSIRDADLKRVQASIDDIQRACTPS
jgi:hypothetical protein